MKDKLRLLKDIKLFVLDMDGTFYLGDRIIDGSLDFLETVKRTGRSFIFFTNNSSKTPSVYVDKLAKMDCHVTEKDVMTSGDVTISYLNTHHKDSPVYLVGTPVLEQSFREGGINLVTDAPELVVVAFDTTITYEKLERACTFIREGATFLATHLDINCPTEDGFIPDCGSICALVSHSTGKQPKYLGKPYAETVEMILEKTGFKRNEIAFVGDRLYTDVATGVNNGSNGFLVLTGETKLNDVENSTTEPDAIFFSLKDIADHLEQLEGR